MREMKVRAWHKRERKWYEPTHIGVNGHRAVMSFYTGSTWFTEGYYSDDFELVEFTGLKDKNGKDIFEGDIVLGFDSGHYRKLQKMWIEYRSYPYIGFYMVPADGLRPHLFGEGDDIEIIGNIYETPELVREE